MSMTGFQEQHILEFRHHMNQFKQVLYFAHIEVFNVGKHTFFFLPVSTEREKKISHTGHPLYTRTEHVTNLILSTSLS